MRPAAGTRRSSIDHWECHPEGDEILCVLEGRLLDAVNRDGDTQEAVIEKGQAFIVPRASWHHLRVLEPGRLLFFTPTSGTALRLHTSEEADPENPMLARE
jgi:mannose-6-phosphate isomerase-like protein (cupin superfamily)